MIRFEPCIQPKPKRHRKEKAVTIGIGLLCNDGVVICSDRQVTNSGGFKYSKRKIYTTGRTNCMLLFSYAGDPDAAEVIYQKVQKAIPEITKQKPSTVGVSPDHTRDVLEKVYKNKHSKELQTLLAVQIDKYPPFLLKTSGTKVIVGSAEYIGVGDCSALRYLSDFIFPRSLNVFEGVTLGDYLVFVANRYIDGCSGGPDHVILHNDGIVTTGTGGPWPNARQRIDYCERQIGEGLRGLLFAGGNGEIKIRPLASQKSGLAK